MRRFLLRALQVALMGVGLWLIGVGIAHADTTDGSNGAGSGNQINPTINTPITLCGNDISAFASIPLSDAFRRLPTNTHTFIGFSMIASIMVFSVRSESGSLHS